MSVPTLVFDANPFCYGSISACLSILPHLPPCRKILLAEGCSAELAGQHFDEVIPCAIKQPHAVAKVLDELGPIKAYVSLCNQSNLAIVKARSIPLVFLDILLWMTEAPHPGMEWAEVYIAEQFPGTETAIQKFQGKIRNLQVVGPLIQTRVTKNRTSGELLVNYGGSASPLLRPGENTSYPWLMTTSLLEAGVANHFDTIHIATGTAAVKSIFQRGVEVPPQVTIGTLDHQAFLEKLQTASCFLTSPGLNAPLERYYHQIPTWFLPPQNVTQVRQLAVYQAAKLGGGQPIQLADLIPGFTLKEQVSEAENTQLVLQALTYLDRTPTARHQLVKELRNILQQMSDAAYPSQMLGLQAAFQAQLGQPGGQLAAQHISRHVL